MVGYDGSELDDFGEGRADAEEEAERELAEMEAEAEEELAAMDGSEDGGPCARCHGRRTVPIALLTPEDPEYAWRGPDWADRDCPRCGGSGREPDPVDVSERRYLYGPGWDE